MLEEGSWIVVKETLWASFCAMQLEEILLASSNIHT